MKKLLPLLLAAAPLFAADPVWIEYGPDGAIARTIVTSGGDCPSIDIDGKRSVMRTRSLPAKGYPVTACEAALPDGVRTASIGGRSLAVAKLGKATKVALVGDTGCRLKTGNPPSIQDCSDPAAWPFAQVAQSIADWDPDVVLHVGDYYYREAECKGTNCTKAPYDWKRWREDFFTPARPLLESAPWVMVRGNHEECGRAAEGWFRFLDPRPYLWENDRTCKSNLDVTAPYVANVGTHQILVLDSSSAKEDDAIQTEMYANQLKLYGGLRPGAWLMLHHPIWAYDGFELDTPTFWNAWTSAGDAIKPISFVLTGHIHLLELLSFSDGGPPLAVVGNGGTELDKPVNDVTGQKAGTRTITRFMQDDGFGFITATPSADGWTLDVRDVQGKSVSKCALTATSLVCD